MRSRGQVLHAGYPAFPGILHSQLALRVLVLESPFLGGPAWPQPLVLIHPYPHNIILYLPPLLKPHSFLGDGGGSPYCVLPMTISPAPSTSCCPKASASFTFKARKGSRRPCIPEIELARAKGSREGHFLHPYRIILGTWQLLP